MNIRKALSKQLFGAKYEGAMKSFAICLILFTAVRTAEIRMEIALSVLFLTAFALSMGIMWEVLHSSGNEDYMAGLFMLPFSNRGMTFSVALAFAEYTLVTKTFPVLALFFAVHKWSALQIAMALLCACNGCFTAAAWYTMTGKRKLIPFVVFWCGGMLLSIFLVREIWVFALIVFASLLFSFLSLLTADAYVFYRPVSAKLLIVAPQNKVPISHTKTSK